MTEALCHWCNTEFQTTEREPGTPGGPKLSYRRDLCTWCNKLVNLCTSGYHYELDHRCGVLKPRFEEQVEWKLTYD